MKVVDVEGLIDKLTYMGYFDENDELKEMIDMFTVCDIEQIRDEIKDARLNQINDETEKAVNYGLNTALEIIEKYTK